MNDLRKNEKGIALLIALFALLLLSAVGLSMMFSSDAETSINANYRDKQQVSYAALSGALEARDRIQPASTSSPSFIPFPTDAPATGSAKVWYIINPGVGESASDIKPWDPDNKYADTEICHDNVMGLSGTNGVPCSGSSSLPSSSAWYATYNNAASGYAGAYKLNNPLQFKWARIQLKTVDSTPTTVAGGTSGQIVCWDGHNQIPKPGGFGTDCRPSSGSVGSVTLTNVGSGYSSAPTVSFSGGGGSGAQATAVLGSSSGGAVTSVTLTNHGTGYTTQPTVTITGVGGSGATAIANLNGGNVTAVNLTGAGSMCYSTAPTVALTGGGGSGANAVAVLDSTTSCVINFTGGTCNSQTFKGNTLDVNIAGGGNDATATVTFKNNGGVDNASVVIKNPGTGYTGNPSGLTYSGTTCASGSAFTLGKRIASFTVTNGGSGYASAPTVTISPGTGTTATLPTATATAVPCSGSCGTPGTIDNIVVTNGGSGYTSATVSISGGGGSNATATASVTPTSQLVAVNVTAGGSGYTSAPTVTLTGGGCTSPHCGTAIASLANGVIYGQVLQITSLAVSRSGSRAMTQMEVATPPAHQLGVTGALTLAGPAGASSLVPPLYESTNSQNFYITGADANSCANATNPPTAAYRPLPAIGVYDDPDHPTTPTAISTVVDGAPWCTGNCGLGRPDHYTGAHSAPDVEDIYTSLGDTNNPSSFESFANTVVAHASPSSIYGNNPNPTTLNLGSSTADSITVVNGDLTLGPSDTREGYGTLLVTGKLTIQGNFTWHGVILVIGQGEMEVSGGGGGGNADITGTVILAKTRDTSGNLLPKLGTPTLDWSGGGGNGIHYDHCWADNILAKIPFNPGPTTQPLKILSTRTISY